MSVLVVAEDSDVFTGVSGLSSASSFDDFVRSLRVEADIETGRQPRGVVSLPSGHTHAVHLDSVTCSPDAEPLHSTLLTKHPLPVSSEEAQFLGKRSGGWRHPSIARADSRLVGLAPAIDQLGRWLSPSDTVVTMVELQQTAQAQEPDLPWSVTWRLHAPSIRRPDLIQNLMMACAVFASEELERETLLLILTELITNAIDHGILSLDSDLKAGPRGLDRYYEERQQRLDGIEVASLLVSLRYETDETGPTFVIVVEDDGDGFDTSRLQDDPAMSADRHSGRGIPILRAYCESVRFNDRGNRATGRFRAPGGRDRSSDSRVDHSSSVHSRR